MHLKEVSSLLPPLFASLALHAGGFALLDAFYGAPLSGGGHNTKRQAPLRVVLSDARQASADSALPSIGPQVAVGSYPSLPEGVVSLPVPYYFPPQALSRKPLPTTPVQLDYPENAPLVAKNHVVLRLLINETGIVDRVIVETTEVPQELENLARQAFAQAKFQPGLRGDIPVKSQMLVEITFETDNSPPPPSAIIPIR